MKDQNFPASGLLGAMAQAARLSLRMQKELKLLIEDPPPGASFPSLSSHSSSVSLSSIDAQIKGPEGSVYEKGIFKLKIQIPERYPFQPPIVTFVTPIYHPNIDTGGRICLDILNLPPKGAWQPSLNVSTLLTSIGLLLSEPNPDDGLMHEASREYKYNRQLFDQKARSMTEKYAEVGASKFENVAQNSQILPSSSTESGEVNGFDSSMTFVQDHSLGQKRIFGASRKLSPGSEFEMKGNEGKAVNEAPISNLDEGQVQIMQLEQQSEATLIEHDKVYKDLQGPRKKLSLGFLDPVQKKNDDDIINVMPFSSLSRPHIPLRDPSKSSPSVQSGFSSQQHLNEDKDSKPTFNITETKLRRDLYKPTSLRQGNGEADKTLCFAPQQSGVQFSSDSHQTPLGPRTTSDLNVADGQGSSLRRVKQKKLGLSGRRLSQEKLGWNQCPQKMNNEGNMAPNSSFSLSHVHNNLTSSSEVPERGNSHNNSRQISTNSSSRLSGTGQIKTSKPFVESIDMKNIGLQLEIQSEDPSRSPSMQNASCNDEMQQPKDYGGRFTSGIKVQEEASPSPSAEDDDAVIVLDSEDSEEEQGRTKRSKISFARRRLPGKRKSQNTSLKIKENT